MRINFCVCFLISIFSVGFANAKDVDDAALVADWLQHNAIPIDTLDIDRGTDDLAPLKEVIGDARIFSMGESTHGTREFYLIKNRLFKFLSSEHGFNLFGLENSFANARPVDEYVVDGKGGDDALFSLDWDSYHTEEFEELVSYMRKHNKGKSADEKLHFYGFDNARQSLELERTFKYLSKVDAAIVSDYKTALIRSDAERFQLDKRDEKRLKLYSELLSEFDNNKTAYVQKSSIKEWSIARQHAEIAYQWEKIYGYGHAVPVEMGGFSAWGIEANLKKGMDNLDQVLETCVKCNRNSISQILPSFNGSFRDFFIHYRFDLTPSQRDEMASSVAKTVEALAAAEDTCLKKVDTKQYLAAQETLSSVQELLKHYKMAENIRPSGKVVNIRDWAMAENVKWMLDYHGEESKAALFAHNAHVLRSSARTGYGMMGDFLEHDFMEDHLAVGFVFNQGGFSAMNCRDIQSTGCPRQEIKIGPAPKGFVGEVMSRPGISMYAVDIRNIPNSGPVYRWFNTPQKMRTISGSIHSDLLDDRYVSEVIPFEAFDLLIFVDTTSGIKLLERKTKK